MNSLENGSMGAGGTEVKCRPEEVPVREDASRLIRMKSADEGDRPVIVSGGVVLDQRQDAF